MDIGCGIGGTAIWLARKLKCDVTGITLSPVQVEMAREASLKIKNKPTFLVADANNLKIDEKYDVIFAVEVISHLENRDNFFHNVARSLKPRGKFCVGAWLKESNLSKNAEKKYIKPIEKGMLLASLPTKEDYFMFLNKNGLKLKYYEDISSRVAKTWALSLNIISNPSLWSLAYKRGKDFTNFLKAFQAMRSGYASGTFRYAVIVATK